MDNKAKTQKDWRGPAQAGRAVGAGNARTLDAGPRSPRAFAAATAAVVGAALLAAFFGVAYATLLGAALIWAVLERWRITRRLFRARIARLLKGGLSYALLVSEAGLRIARLLYEARWHPRLREAS